MREIEVQAGASFVEIIIVFPSDCNNSEGNYARPGHAILILFNGFQRVLWQRHLKEVHIEAVYTSQFNVKQSGLVMTTDDFCLP